jgi:hypothetical protein
MALDTSKMLAAIGGGSIIPINKGTIANQAAGYITSLWRATGTPLWQQGAIPGAAAVCDDNLAGGIILPAFSTNIARIYRFAPNFATIGTAMLYDRLAHMGGLSGVTTGDQTVNVAVATPISNGRATANEIEWYAEMYTDIGTAAQTCTVTYVDTGDNTKTLTFSLGGASPLNRASRCIQLVPTDGINIKSVTKVNFGTTTGTAGSWGITARKRMTSVGCMIANVLPPTIDAISIGLPAIKDTTCLEMLVQCSTTSTGIIQGELLYGQVAE